MSPKAKPTFPEKKENFSKMSLEQLEEVFERQTHILKNKKLTAHLPDKGKQLQEKLEEIKKEIKMRQDLSEVEKTMQTLSINQSNSEILTETHVQHVCAIEKTPEKERYKPSQTLNKKKDQVNDKPTQLISLAESMTLLTEQATRLPGEQVKLKIEGDETDESEDDEEKERSELIELT